MNFWYHNHCNPGCKVVVLRGNHESYSYMHGVDGLHYSEYINRMPEDVRTQVEEFYRLLPFNVIINNSTYVVHGGLPGYPGLDFLETASKLLSRDQKVYPKDVKIMSVGDRDLVYSSLWSDFDPDLSEEYYFTINPRRKCFYWESSMFGRRMLTDYAVCFNKRDKTLKIKNFIFGHDHNKAPFAQTEFFADSEHNSVGYVTTVITSPGLTISPMREKRGGSVALVSPLWEKPEQYLNIKAFRRGGERNVRIQKLITL